jgi:hypothetical protein
MSSFFLFFVVCISLTKTKKKKKRKKKGPKGRLSVSAMRICKGEKGFPFNPANAHYAKLRI